MSRKMEIEIETVKDLLEILKEYNLKCKVFLTDPGKLVVKKINGETDVILKWF